MCQNIRISHGVLYNIMGAVTIDAYGMGGWVNHHKLCGVSGVGYDEGFGSEYKDLTYASIQDHGCCNHRGMRDG